MLNILHIIGLIILVYIRNTMLIVFKSWQNTMSPKAKVQKNLVFLSLYIYVGLIGIRYLVLTYHHFIICFIFCSTDFNLHRNRYRRLWLLLKAFAIIESNCINELNRIFYCAFAFCLTMNLYVLFFVILSCALKKSFLLLGVLQKSLGLQVFLHIRMKT